MKIQNQVAHKLVEALKTELNKTWFAAVAERNQKRKAALLEEYRALKRAYETQAMLSA